jgi:hypothetical protein
MAYHPTLLRQLLQCVQRLEFERLARNPDSPRRSDALSRLSKFFGFLVGHAGQRRSHRDIGIGIRKRARSMSF